MKPFLEIYDDLEPDGAHRDFYIENTSSDDWNTFLTTVPRIVEEYECRSADGICELPSTFSEVRKIQEVSGASLLIKIDGKDVNCYFFTAEEIELDFIPNDFREENRWNQLVHFFQTLVNAIGLRGIIVQENNKKYLIHEIKPN